jgi:hypothetical protein
LETQLQDLESYIQDLEVYIQQEEAYIQQEEAYIQQEEDHCRCRHCCYQSRKKGLIQHCHQNFRYRTHHQLYHLGLIYRRCCAATAAAATRKPSPCI